MSKAPAKTRNAKGPAQTPATRKRKAPRVEVAIVALFVGRLAFHAKANPIPMYMGLEQAAKRTGKRISLVLSG